MAKSNPNKENPVKKYQTGKRSEAWEKTFPKPTDKLTEDSNKESCQNETSQEENKNV